MRGAFHWTLLHPEGQRKRDGENRQEEQPILWSWSFLLPPFCLTKDLNQSVKGWFVKKKKKSQKYSLSSLDILFWRSGRWQHSFCPAFLKPCAYIKSRNMHYHFLFNSGWMLLALSGLCANTRTVWFLFSAKIEPPKISSVKPVLGLKKMVQIKWTQPVLAPKSSTLNYALRFRAVNSTHWVSYAIIMFLRELLMFVDLESIFFYFLHLK